MGANLLFYVAESGPSYEDFTTYTEVDPNEDLTVITNQIAAVTMRRDVEAGIYKDFGSDYFSGDFVFEWSFNLTAGTGSGNATVFSLSKDYYLSKADKDSNNDGLYVGIRLVGGANFRIWLADANETIEDSYTIGGGPPRERWLTLTRSGTTVTLQIYDDSNRTSLLDTLQISQSSARSYDYMYPISSGEISGSDTLTYTVSNLIKL